MVDKKRIDISFRMFDIYSIFPNIFHLHLLVQVGSNFNFSTHAIT